MVAIGAVLLFAAFGAAFIHYRGIPEYNKPPKVNFKVEATPEKVVLGKKIATVQCNFCHINDQTGRLTGSFRPDVPKLFGTVYSANITQDKKSGIGNWTNGELAYFIRTGLRPDGKYAPLYMPKYPLMADEDLEAVIAFLRSDDDLVKATEARSIPPEPSFITKFLCTFVFTPLEYPKEKIKKPAMNDPISYGRYLVNAQYDCYGCHSADFTTNDLRNPEKSKGYLGGGNTLLNMQRKEIYTANLTFDKETGMGNWTEEEFVKALKTGKLPNGKTLRYPMLPYVLLEDEEARAIYAYLKTVPVIKNKVNRQY